MILFLVERAVFLLVGRLSRLGPHLVGLIALRHSINLFHFAFELVLFVLRDLKQLSPNLVFRLLDQLALKALFCILVLDPLFVGRACVRDRFG